MWNHKRHQIAKKYSEHKRTKPDFKLNCKAIVIKTMWYWHKNIHIDQWNRTESPELNLGMYSQLIFNKGAMNTSGGKDSPSTNNAGKNMQNNEIGPLYHITHKNSLEMDKRLQHRLDNIKLLEENIDQRLINIGLSNDFLHMTPKTQATKGKINKWDHIKLKSPCTTKETMQWNDKL